MTSCNNGERVPMSVEITDADVHDDVGTALEEFADLRSILPPGFPRHVRFGITRERMQSYSDDRQQLFWHLLNIPLALHAYRLRHPLILSQMSPNISRNVACSRISSSYFRMSASARSSSSVASH